MIWGKIVILDVRKYTSLSMITITFWHISQIASIVWAILYDAFALQYLFIRQ